MLVSRKILKQSKNSLEAGGHGPIPIFKIMMVKHSKLYVRLRVYESLQERIAFIKKKLNAEQSRNLIYEIL